MFAGSILDVAVGLIFVFLAVSLICGLLTEVCATAMAWRANTLLDGIKSLVNDEDFNGLAKALYNHAMVNPRDSGTADTEAQLNNKPAYVDPLHFANAMLDTLQITAGTVRDMHAAIDQSALLKNDTQLSTLLKGMAERANGDVTTLRNAIAGWFDAGMDRLSGSYKRKTQAWCFAFGLLVAGALNIDTFQVASALWKQPQITHSITATQDATAAMAGIDKLGLPIGWAPNSLPEKWSLDSWAKPLGWIITALSTLFGASFWFDTLSGLLKIRGTGPAPDKTT